jgi:hypothetical protein
MSEDVSITDLIAEARQWAVENCSPPLLGSIHIVSALADALEAVTVPTENEAAKIMQVLNEAGAYCGECDYERGYGEGGCSQCLETLTGYANALIEAGFRLPVPVETTEVLSGLAVAMMGTTDGEMLSDDVDVPAGEMYRLAAEYISSLIPPVVVPVEPEKPVAFKGGPHSRACGIKKHDHGTACHTNCHTCEGGTQ